jgi:hypothetical protein
LSKSDIVFGRKRRKKSMAHIDIKPVLFTTAGQHGDFEYMFRQEKYKDALFLIQENVVDSLTSDVAGAGTACLRPYTYRLVLKNTRPHAAGIPTGWSVDSGGFTELNKPVKSTIQWYMQRIRLLLQEHHYTSIVYSCDKDDKTKIGQGIFVIANEVVEYIRQEISLLHNLSNTSLTMTHTELDGKEKIHVLPFALKQQIREVKLENRELRRINKELQAENAKLRSALGFAGCPSPVTPVKRKYSC